MMRKMKHRMMVFMYRRMIACDEASYLVSYQYDNKLGVRKWMALKMHLISCHLCRKYASQLKQLAHAMERYREGCSESCHHHLPEGADLKIQAVVSRELNAK
jgi:hypothetical protein